MRRLALVLSAFAIASIANALPVKVSNGLCVHQSGRELVQASAATQEAYLNALVATGWKILHTDFTWQLIEPSPGQFDFGAYDALMQRIETAGLKVIGVLDYGNPWAAAGATDDRTPPTDPATFATFAGAVAAHYKGRISLWEVWDEPNRADGSTWRPAPNPAQYAALFAAAARAIHKADKKVQIITGGLVPGDQGDASTPATDDAHKFWGFLNKAFGPKKKQRRLAKRAKGAALHPVVLNGTGAPELSTTLTELSLSEQLFRFTDRTFAAKLTRLDPYISSIGWRTGASGVSEAEQAAFLVRAATLGLAQDAQRFCWSHLADGDEAFGLYRRGGDGTLTAKPAVAAASTFATLLADTSFLADLTEELGLAQGTRAICFQSGKQTVILFWSLTEGRTFTYDSIRTGITGVRLVDINGTTTELARNAAGKWDPVVMTLGAAPIYLITDGL